MVDTDARCFFGAVRQASDELRGYRRELEAIRARAAHVGGSTFDTIITGGPSDRIGANVAAMLDAEAGLRERAERNARLVQLARAVVYGTERLDGIADLLRNRWQADALHLHYVRGMSWADVDAATGHSHSHKGAYHALDVCDRYNLVAMHERRAAES